MTRMCVRTRLHRFLECGHVRWFLKLVNEPDTAAFSTLYSERTKAKHMSDVFASPTTALKYVEGPEDLFAKLNSELATSVEL